MKTRASILVLALAAGFVAGCSKAAPTPPASPASSATPTAPAATTPAPAATATPAKLPRPELPKSVFVMPAAPPEGRDPFFPYSMRVFSENPKNQSKTNSVAPTMADVVLKSIYTTPDGVVLALINNHTVAPGDDATVTTGSGQRVSIHCISINQAAGTVTIEVNGARVVLTVTHGQ
jgi:hypothetical protein